MAGFPDMTIELAPHHMLIVTNYWMIIPWSDLRKSRSFPGFCSTGALAPERSGGEQGGSHAAKASENRGREHWRDKG
ncbi:MAG: hypothetical protein C4B57_04910 [Deltaproteobacteria bacterium]|nr:MAG: hypothetical protein C4B57_04910 [Deltaproteobacteria bacterium]